jgi:Transposase and inactivated derivatives
MAVARRTLPDLSGLDADALRVLVLAQQEELASRDTEIDNLRLLILKLKRMQFGRKSEKLDKQIEQLELRLEDLEANQMPGLACEPAMRQTPEVPNKPARRPLPEQLPRETEMYVPKHEVCPDCGSQLRPLGEDVSEILEYVPARFKVIRQVRPKLSCGGCERIVQEPAPSRPIDRGLAGPGLLAHVLVAKYADHLPLYRQSEIYEREGIELDRSTLADWVGGASRVLAPLVEATRRYVLNTSKLHGDDIPVPVLAPGNGRTKTARLWTYVRDDRPAGDTAAPAVWFAYSPDRKGDHPQQHLGGFTGTLQADGYAGFNRCMKAAKFRKQLAGLMCAASSLIWIRRTLLRSRLKLWHGLGSCTVLSARFGAARPMRDGRFGKRGHDRCSTKCISGYMQHWRSCRRNRQWRQPSTMRSAAGSRCCVSPRTAALRSTTTPRNARCDRLPLDGRIISSQELTPVVNAPPRSTA